MKKIIAIPIIIILLVSSIVLASNIEYKQPSQNFILVEFNENNLDQVQMVLLPPNAILDYVEIISWDFEKTKQSKPPVVFYPTSESSPDLTYSRMIHEAPYDYEVLLKGRKKYVRFFVPTISYDDNNKIETSYFKAKIYYQVDETPPSFYPAYDPQSPDYEYVILTNETFWPIFNAHFKDWKISTDSKINDIWIVNVTDITDVWRGFTVNDTYGDATNTSNGNHWIPDGKEVTSNWDLFNDTQAQIRNFLRDCYDTESTRYVLLGGNKDVVPPRMATSYAVGNCGSCTGWDNDTSHAADMYYACLDYNMNNNTNAYWMENDCCGTDWDEIDWGFDLHVGRVLAGTKEKLFNWINKTKAYVNATTSDEGNYLDNFIVACKDNANSISNQTWTGWVASWGSFGPDIGDEFASNQSIVNNQNITQAQWITMDEYVNGSAVGYDGIHFIYHTGHGGTLYSSEGGIYRPYQVNNTEKPTFVYSEGCHTGDFGTDVNSRTERWMEYPECSHVLVTNSAYGWFVASTYYGEKFMQEMFNSSYGNYTATFCEANELSRERGGHVVDCVFGMIYKETNFFGDPALEFRWYQSNSSVIEFVNIDGGVNMTNIYTPNPTFNWSFMNTTGRYWLQVANDSAFTDLVINLSDINEIIYPNYHTISYTFENFDDGVLVEATTNTSDISIDGTSKLQGIYCINGTKLTGTAPNDRWEFDTPFTGVEYEFDFMINASRTDSSQPMQVQLWGRTWTGVSWIDTYFIDIEFQGNHSVRHNSNCTGPAVEHYRYFTDMEPWEYDTPYHIKIYDISYAGANFKINLSNATASQVLSGVWTRHLNTTWHNITEIGFQGQQNTNYSYYLDAWTKSHEVSFTLPPTNALPVYNKLYYCRVNYYRRSV